MKRYKKFSEWLSLYEDMNAQNPMDKRTNDQIAQAAASYAKKTNLIPGSFKMQQLHQAMSDPQIKALGPNAGKAIDILKGGDSLSQIKKPGNQ